MEVLEAPVYKVREEHLARLAVLELLEALASLVPRVHADSVENRVAEANKVNVDPTALLDYRVGLVVMEHGDRMVAQANRVSLVLLVRPDNPEDKVRVVNKVWLDKPLGTDLQENKEQEVLMDKQDQQDAQANKVNEENKVGWNMFDIILLYYLLLDYCLTS